MSYGIYKKAEVSIDNFSVDDENNIVNFKSKIISFKKNIDNMLRDISMLETMENNIALDNNKEVKNLNKNHSGLSELAQILQNARKIVVDYKNAVNSVYNRMHKIEYKPSGDLD